MINLNNKKFRSLENSDNGEVSGETLFNYYQEDNRVWADYSGGSVVKGHLIATMDEEGALDMRYHHINKNNEIMTGRCISTPEILDNGQIRYFEKWQWTSGDESSGESVIQEVDE